MSRIIILLLIVVAVSARTTRRPVEPIRDCGPNAVWVKCATVCPETCETIKNPQPVFCTKQCYRGCVCQEGFVKRTKESVECILPEQC